MELPPEITEKIASMEAFMASVQAKEAEALESKKAELVVELSKYNVAEESVLKGMDVASLEVALSVAKKADEAIVKAKQHSVGEYTELKTEEIEAIMSEKDTVEMANELIAYALATRQIPGMSRI